MQFYDSNKKENEVSRSEAAKKLWDGWGHSTRVIFTFVGCVRELEKAPLPPKVVRRCLGTECIGFLELP